MQAITTHTYYLNMFLGLETTLLRAPQRGNPYALFDNDTFILAPTPPSALSFELHYNYRPNSLTTVGDDSKSWLSENAPNAMLYGALVEGAVFMKTAPETLMLYEQKFQEALAMLKRLGEFKDIRDEARHDQIKIMPQGPANV